MVYPVSAEQTPYDVRIWHCNGFKEHWHSSMEIYLCLQGELRIRVEHADYAMKPGDALLVAGNEIHEIFCSNAETYVILISFGYSLLGPAYKMLQNVCFDKPFFNLKDETIAAELRDPLQQITALLQAPAQATDWKLRGCLYTIAACLTAHTHARTVSEQRLLRSRQLDKLQGVLQYIRQHFREDISLARAAEEAGYDTSYFCKLFRAATGMTFHRYLNEYRISVVCRLLTETDASISAIGEMAGFPCQKKLNRLFRDIMGLTPSMYRKLLPEERSHVRLL